MTTYKKILIIALAAASALVVVPTTKAQHISVEIGDRGYYTHGPSYWHNGAQLYWVPGHWGHHHHWIHGHYVRRSAGVYIAPPHVSVHSHWW